MHHHQAVFAAGFIVVIALLSLAINDPSVFANVIKTDTCGELGCYELCESNLNCNGVEVCCPTAYKQGVCYYENQCDDVTQRFNQADKTLEQPTPIQLDFVNFFFPLLILLLALFVVVIQAKNRKH
jgi:hypothetical protein